MADMVWQSYIRRTEKEHCADGLGKRVLGLMDPIGGRAARVGDQRMTGSCGSWTHGVGWAALMASGGVVNAMFWVALRGLAPCCEVMRLVQPSSPRRPRLYCNGKKGPFTVV
jgi:hypothetical protein